MLPLPGCSLRRFRGRHLVRHFVSLQPMVGRYGCFYKLGGPCCGCLCNKGPTTWGLGPVILGNSLYGCRCAEGVLLQGNRRGLELNASKGSYSRYYLNSHHVDFHAAPSGSELERARCWLLPHVGQSRNSLKGVDLEVFMGSL